jgi:hypothetical protein
MKLLNMQFSPVLCYVISGRSKYTLPSVHVLSSQCEAVSHPYKTMHKTSVLCTAHVAGRLNIGAEW